MSVAPDEYPDECPKCKTQFETDNGFSRVIGLSDGDSIQMWRCPDCGHAWQRTEPPAFGFRRCNVVMGQIVPVK